MTALWNPTTGDEPDANDLLTWRPIVAMKANDESRVTATLAADASLTIPLGAGTFEIEQKLIWQASSSFDIAFSWTTPATAAGWWTVTAPSLGAVATAPFLGALAWNAGGQIEGTGANAFSRLSGVMVTTSPGTLTFNWAQNSGGATATIVRQYSLLVARQVA